MANDIKTTSDLESLDLVLTRVIDAPRALVWRAWTEPEHLKKWWVPKPWQLVDCEVDLRPGGVFNSVMRSPEGADHPMKGLYLEVVDGERIVFTDALVAEYRPAEEPFFTAIITFEDHDGGTKYTARAMHKNDVDRQKHEEMGFHTGWGTCADQLADLVQSWK